MNWDVLEKKYMERSWSKETSQPYKTNKIDRSVKEFYSFLRRKKANKGSVLDLGCGNGKNTIFFQKKGFDSTGIDFAKSAITICKTNARLEKANPSFTVASVLKYRAKERFAAVIDCGCLHHIRRKHWGEYKKTILSNLKVGGYLYLHGISDCEENKKLPKHPKKRNWIVNNRGHYTAFLSYQEIKKLFGNKFRIEKHYECQSPNSPLRVRVFYAKRLN